MTICVDLLCLTNVSMRYDKWVVGGTSGIMNIQSNGQYADVLRTCILNNFQLIL